MMRRLSKWAGILLAMSLVLGLPFVAATAGQFTVEFNADGTINRVFGGSVESPRPEIHPDPGNMKGVITHLRGKSLDNITTVSIVTTADQDPCIIDSSGRGWCW